MLGKKMFLLYAVQFICLVAKGHSLPHPQSEESIDIINSKQNTSKSDRNFPENVTMEYLKMFAGTVYDSRIQDLPLKTHTKGLSLAVIESFDARQKWPYCYSLNEIWDQGACGSCWAVSAVSTMNDRLCIHSTGHENFHLSISDVLSCSNTCGCGGGNLYDPWIYWMMYGIVSGGPYDSQEGCQPYEFPPCPVEGCKAMTVQTPRCKDYCQDNYQFNYTQDKNFGKYVYRVNGEEEIKADIMTNGPVTVQFPVYQDIFQHTTGVYKHTWGEKQFGHAVKVIGWGVENGEKYWLIANSWGTGKGDKGFLKFLRGENHLGIEEYAVAGLPR